MQIHEFDTFDGTPSASDYFVIDDGSGTKKIPATYVSDLVTTKNAQTSTQTIAGNSGASYSLNMHIDGYKPIGILHLQNNAGSTVVISGFWWSGTDVLNIFMKNTSSTAQSGIYAIATVAYIKS